MFGKNKKVDTRVLDGTASQYEMFSDIHLRIDDILVRAGSEYTSKCKGDYLCKVTVKNDKYRCEALGRIREVTFVNRGSNGSFDCKVSYVSSSGIIGERTIPDIFTRPYANRYDRNPESEYKIVKNITTFMTSLEAPVSNSAKPLPKDATEEVKITPVQKEEALKKAEESEAKKSTTKKKKAEPKVEEKDEGTTDPDIQ